MHSPTTAPLTLRHPDPFQREVIEALKDHAVAEYPNESCGLVLRSKAKTPTISYLPCKNVHESPTDHFRIDPKVTMQHVSRIAAVVHSHPNGPNFPTYDDQVAQISSGMTWGIVPVIGVTSSDESAPVQAIPSEPLWWGDDLPTPPLERRLFIWGIFHCWQVARDWYWLERGIRLPNFACDPDFVKVGENIFLDNVTRAGLKNIGKVEIGCLQVGDILVGHLQGEHPSHCGVYLGGDHFLHHPPGGASGPAELIRWWPYIDTVFRYDDEAVSSLRLSSREVRPDA